MCKKFLTFKTFLCHSRGSQGAQSKFPQVSAAFSSSSGMELTQEPRPVKPAADPIELTTSLATTSTSTTSSAPLAASHWKINLAFECLLYLHVTCLSVIELLILCVWILFYSGAVELFGTKIINATPPGVPCRGTLY